MGFNQQWLFTDAFPTTICRFNKYCFLHPKFHCKTLENFLCADDKWVPRSFILFLFSKRTSVHKAPPWTLPLFVKSFHIFHSHAENEEVLLSSLLCHLHIGSVHSADGEGSIQHELHVPCTRGLSACCGDLLRQVRSWDNWGERFSSLQLGFSSPST